MMINNIDIIKEEDIELKNGKWEQITYDSGEVVLKKFDEEFNIWITQRFPKSLA